ncbi:MAG TPA: hypothetical protein VEY30_06530, partial [Myxococcaceae bacterium]|nr:hypothetical protein [Myxococcaceae bacterium]
MAEVSGLPSRWRELRQWPGVAKARQTLGVARQVLDQAGLMGEPAMAVGPDAPEVCCVAIVDGPGAVVPTLNDLKATLESAAQESRPGPDVLPFLPDFLGYLNAADCCGVLSKPLGGANAKGWLEAVAKRAGEMEERDVHAAAFAALGSGLPALVARLLRIKLPSRFEPGERFGFNSVGFLEYVATAQQKGAGARDLVPAFEDLVASFPRKLGAGTLNWPDLMWAARAYY